MNKEQLITDHFNGQLTEEGITLFKHYLDTDADFKQEVAFQNSVQQAIKKKEYDRLKLKLQHTESQIKRYKTIKVWLSVAASILIFVSLGFYLFNGPATPTELYSEYYKTPKNIVHPIVRNANVQDDETKAFIAYQKQEYEIAHQLLHKVFIATQKSELLFYEAIALLKLNKTDQAIQKLEEHKTYNDAVSDRTNWYLALAYLKNDNVQKAKDILSKISSDSTEFNYNDAKKLLKKL